MASHALRLAPDPVSTAVCTKKKRSLQRTPSFRYHTPPCSQAIGAELNPLSINHHQQSKRSHHNDPAERKTPESLGAEGNTALNLRERARERSKSAGGLGGAVINRRTERDAQTLAAAGGKTLTRARKSIAPTLYLYASRRRDLRIMSNFREARARARALFARSSAIIALATMASLPRDAGFVFAFSCMPEYIVVITMRARAPR